MAAQLSKPPSDNLERIGSRRVRNDRPIVGPYGVSSTGSGDMYTKGGSMLHTIRHIVPDGAQWRGILRGINGTFDASPGLTKYEHDSRFTLAQPAARNVSETRIVFLS